MNFYSGYSEVLNTWKDIPNLHGSIVSARVHGHVVRGDYYKEQRVYTRLLVLSTSFSSSALAGMCFSIVVILFVSGSHMHFFSTGFLSRSKLIFWLSISQISQHSGTTAASTISVPKTPNGPSCEFWVYESATCLAWVLSKSIYFLNGLSFYFRIFQLGWPSLGHNMTKSEMFGIWTIWA